MVDVMLEIVKVILLNGLLKGSKVNLERVMFVNGWFGGYFVLGYVDGMVEIIWIEKKSNVVYYDLKLFFELMKMFVLKGLIMVDGVSLMIFGLLDESVMVFVILYIILEMIFWMKVVGLIVNIECDMIGKYLYCFLYKIE